MTIVLFYHDTSPVLSLYFSTPNWKLDDRMANDRTKEAMNLMFATILQRWGGTEVDPTGILLSLLQQSSDWLKEMATKHPGHPFSMIPILSTLELLRDLKELVTLEPKGNVKCVTEISPHIQNASVAKRFCHFVKPHSMQLKE